MTVTRKAITTQEWSWTPMWRIKQIMFHVKHCETQGDRGDIVRKRVKLLQKAEKIGKTHEKRIKGAKTTV